MGKKRLIYNIISIAVFLGISIFVSIFIGPKLIETISKPDEFRSFINENKILGILAFLFIQVLQVFFSLIPGEPIEVFAGYGFGAFWGLILCCIGVTLASAAIFWLTRRFGRRFTYILVAEDKLSKLKFMQGENRADLLLFILYFIPGTPKDLITYFAGLTKITFRKFIIISCIARIPSILTSTLAGATLQNKNYLLSAIVFGITGVISIVGIVIYNKICNNKAKKNSN